MNSTDYGLGNETEDIKGQIVRTDKDSNYNMNMKHLKLVMFVVVDKCKRGSKCVTIYYVNSVNMDCRTGLNREL